MMQPRGVAAIFAGILYTSSAITPAPTVPVAPVVGVPAPAIANAAPAPATALQQLLAAAATTTTTKTAWDSAVSLSLSSGHWKSSGFIGSTLLSSSGGSSGGSSNSLNSDMSNSGDEKSLGSDRSGSSGLFLRIWMWLIIAALVGCCYIGLGALVVAFMMKKNPKRGGRGGSGRRQAPRDRDFEMDQDFEMQQNQTLLPEPPAQQMAYEQPPVQEAPPPPVEVPQVQEAAPLPAMANPTANSYYTQYPGGSNYMQYSGASPYGGAISYPGMPAYGQQPASVMQPMTQMPFGQPAPGSYVV